MTATELIDALEKTGTGERKLERMRRAVEERSLKHHSDLIRHLAEEKEADGTPAYPEGTVVKAQALANGARVDDFLGKPPPNHEDARMANLADKVATKFADKLKDHAIGKLEKPSGAR